MTDTPDFRLNDFLPYLFNQAAEAVGQQFAQVYKDRYGMLRTEWRLLAHLGESDGLTAKQIGAAAHIHKTKVSRAVLALEQKRFVTRQTSDSDRRSARLELTKSGWAAFQDLAGIAKRYDQELADQLGPQAHADLLAVLRELAGR